ncbi:hypothetical protein DRJ17_00515 [Candidatus Woesearchaeota archaeon]|nr:MAG: hypothetical protein DRJ17_00515 [Candidatus Woesearchaeota archaeon]
MKSGEAFKWVVSTIASYFCIYIAFYIIKNVSVINLWLWSLIFLVLLFIAILVCPFLNKMLCTCQTAKNPKRKKSNTVVV